MSSANTGCLTLRHSATPFCFGSYSSERSLFDWRHFSQGTKTPWYLLTWSVFKELFSILKTCVSNYPERWITYRRQSHQFKVFTARLFVNPGFLCRCRHSVQNQVGLHEAQLWKQDTQLHEGGESRQSSAILPQWLATLYRIDGADLLSLHPQLVEATKSIQDDKVRSRFVKASEFLVETLKAAKYNSCYFGRTEKKQDRLCTKEGWFTCQV